MNTFDILIIIREKPFLFFKEKKISFLWYYLSGFQKALHSKRVKEISLPNFDFFSTWICGRIDTEYDMSAGWHWHILKFYKDGEEIAFEKFFHYLDEFKKAIPKIERQSINENQKLFYENLSGARVSAALSCLLILPVSDRNRNISLTIASMQSDLSVACFFLSIGWCPHQLKHYA